MLATSNRVERFVCRDPAELFRATNGFATEHAIPGIARFAGQGCDWSGELRGLLQNHASVRTFIAETAGQLEAFAHEFDPAFSLASILATPSSQSQPRNEEAVTNGECLATAIDIHKLRYSTPLIGLTQLANFWAVIHEDITSTACTVGESLQRRFATCTGLSQGIIAAVAVATSSTVDSFMQNSQTAVRLLFLIGLFMEKGLNTGSADTDGMLAVRGVRLTQLRDIMVQHGGKTPPVQVAVRHSASHHILSGPKNALRLVQAAILEAITTSTSDSRLSPNESQLVSATFLDGVPGAFHHLHNQQLAEKVTAIAIKSSLAWCESLILPIHMCTNGLACDTSPPEIPALIEAVMCRPNDWCRCMEQTGHFWSEQCTKLREAPIAGISKASFTILAIVDFGPEASKTLPTSRMLKAAEEQFDSLNFLSGLQKSPLLRAVITAVQLSDIENNRMPRAVVGSVPGTIVTERAGNANEYIGPVDGVPNVVFEARVQGAIRVISAALQEFTRVHGLSRMSVDHNDSSMFDTNASFMSLGLSSQHFAVLAGQLSKWLPAAGPIRVDTLFRYPTIRGLAAFIADTLLRREKAGKIPLTPSGRQNERSRLGIELHSEILAPDSGHNHSARTPSPNSGDNADDDDIAIVGLACRFPGGANSPEEFWKCLLEGSSRVTEPPANRQDFFSPPRTSSSRPSSPNSGTNDASASQLDVESAPKIRAGFLDGVDVCGFDSNFFSVSPREADVLDPQHRLLLECSWEALENAGYAPGSERMNIEMARQCGVYVGIWSADYRDQLIAGGMGSTASKASVDNSSHSMNDRFLVSGNSMSAASGRISHLFDLGGPSLSIDTACSSSLVAIHEACQSLRAKARLLCGKIRGPGSDSLGSDSPMCVAGGVNLILSRTNHQALASAHMLSPSHECHTFSPTADGYARGEGCGVVVLKHLRDAQRDGDAVLAVVRGSAINQDGHSMQMTAPSGLAQERVLLSALESARLLPRDVSYIEAHGTGTLLGDPIEVGAITQVYNEAPHPKSKNTLEDRKGPLHIGSLKATFGHLEAAAGVAGLIKVVLSLQHRTLPPHALLESDSVNAKSETSAPWIWNENVADDSRRLLHINTKPMPWKPFSSLPPTETAFDDLDGPRFAGVSSFGLSGTNAHVILQEANERVPMRDDDSNNDDDYGEETGESVVMCLAAQSRRSLQVLCHRLAQFVTTKIEHFDGSPRKEASFLRRLSYSLSHGRNLHFTFRCAFIVLSIVDWKHKLEQVCGFLQLGASRLNTLPGVFLSSNCAGKGVPTLRAEPMTLAPRRHGVPEAVFLFTGQGSQYPQMGQELFHQSRFFRRAAIRCDKLFQMHLNFSVIDKVVVTTSSTTTTGKNGCDDVHNTLYTQPGLFMLQYALAETLMHYGIVPAALLGHSVGEFAAACVAGVFSLEDATWLVATRAQLMAKLPSNNGSMVATNAPLEDLHIAMKQARDEVAIAAINGPCNFVLSGGHESLLVVAAALRLAGYKTKFLRVSHAFHSIQMRAMIADFRKVAEQIAYSQPKYLLVPTQVGFASLRSSSCAMANAEYWVRHVCSTVDFWSGVNQVATSSQLRSSSGVVFIEVGPAPALLGLLARAESHVPTDATCQILRERALVSVPILRAPSQTKVVAQPFLHAQAMLFAAGLSLRWKVIFEDKCATAGSCSERFVEEKIPPIPKHPRWRFVGGLPSTWFEHVHHRSPQSVCLDSQKHSAQSGTLDSTHFSKNVDPCKSDVPTTPHYSNREAVFSKKEVKRCILAVLGFGDDPQGSIQPSGSILNSSDLNTLGIDSLMNIEISRALSELAGVEVDADVVLEHASINAIFDFLAVQRAKMPVSVLDDPASSARLDQSVSSTSTAADGEPLFGIQRAYWIGMQVPPELGGVHANFFVEYTLCQRAVSCQPASIEAAIRDIIRSQPGLRLVLTKKGKARVLPSSDVCLWSLEVNDLRQTSASRDQQWRRYFENRQTFQKDASQRLDKALASRNLPLFAATLCRVDDNTTILMVAWSLLLIDGFSESVFRRQLGERIGNIVFGRSDFKPAFYSDDEYWRVTHLVTSTRAAAEASQRYRQAKEYWMGRLATLPRRPEVPTLQQVKLGSTDPISAADTSCNGLLFSHHQFNLPFESLESLRNSLATMCPGVSLNATLCALYALTLARWTSNNAILLTVMTSHRNRRRFPGIEKLISNFGGTVLLACDVSKSAQLGRSVAFFCSESTSSVAEGYCTHGF
eukprot:INCI17568.1.p1 GENE.INCI17568.1~~INCI17568.1.p1  ORF type:complete len:2233 (-),score=336.22 INCI17568.1:1325-8023(-)